MSDFTGSSRGPRHHNDGRAGNAGAGPSVAPGKRTLTMGLAPRPGLAPSPAEGPLAAPVQRKPDPSAEPARMRLDATRQWTNVVMRPDIHVAPVQRRAAGAETAGAETLPAAGGGKTMPEDVQAKMAGAFGADFSGVRIHEGSQAPAMGALAYTQGSDIHFAPGQYDPGSQRGQELLGHELTHVVQQSQGRVSATTQAKGVGVNDDAGLEREADEMGTKAARGEGIGARTQGAGVAKLENRQGDESAGPIQRKVGFEFESAGDNAWRFQGRNLPSDNWAGISHTKDILVDTPNAKAGAGADTGKVEFITRPLSTWDEVRDTLNELVDMATFIQANSPWELQDPQNSAAKQRSGMEHHRLTAHGAFRAQCQATLGTMVLNVPELLRIVQRLNNSEDNLGDIGGRSEYDVLVGADALAYQANVSSEQAVYFIEQARQAFVLANNIPQDWDVDATLGDAPSELDEAAGLLTIIFKTLWDAWSNSGSQLTDPKYAFAMMARTDFRSMFTSMSPSAQAAFAQLWNTTLGPLVDHEYPLSEPVFTSGYKAGEGGKGRQKGPTKAAWINSIIHGGDPKDLLSPPPTYPRHHTTARPEGIGAYQTDPEDPSLVLFELRDLSDYGKRRLEPLEWIELARSVCRLVALAEGDDELFPT